MSPATPATPATSALEVDGTSVAIEGRLVVHDVTLRVEPGEFVVLMGANGSGKSTLVRAMTGVLPAAGGQISVLGTPIERLREHHRIGYVPQRGGASSGVPASVTEVVASGRISRRRIFSPTRSADRAAVSEALEVVGLTDRAGERVTALSGGQQQRVLIARALAAQPDILFLDEPMAGVDLPNQQALAETLGRLSERGATIVLVAHELGVITPLIDRCIVMRDGRIAYDGLPLSEWEVHATTGFGLGVPAPREHPDPDRQHEHHHEHHEPHHEHVQQAHEPAPHACGPGHSDAVPYVGGPLDFTRDDQGPR